MKKKNHQIRQEDRQEGQTQQGKKSQLKNSYSKYECKWGREKHHFQGKPLRVGCFGEKQVGASTTRIAHQSGEKSMHKKATSKKVLRLPRTRYLGQHGAAEAYSLSILMNTKYAAKQNSHDTSIHRLIHTAHTMYRALLHS